MFDKVAVLILLAFFCCALVVGFKRVTVRVLLALMFAGLFLTIVPNMQSDSIGLMQLEVLNFTEHVENLLSQGRVVVAQEKLHKFNRTLAQPSCKGEDRMRMIDDIIKEGSSSGQ